MTRADTAKILAMLAAEYPNSFTKMDENTKRVKLELWCNEFKNDSFESVYTAVRMCMESGADFAPNIGQLRKRMRMQTEQAEMSEGEAWALVSKACRNGSYGYKKEFEKLPPIVQRAVGTPEQLKEWAAMDESTVQSVIASNFQRGYRSIRERQREKENYSPALKSMIEKTQLSMGREPLLEANE